MLVNGPNLSCAVIGDVTPEDGTDRVCSASSPEDIHIIAAGGNSGGYNEVIMVYDGVPITTVLVREPEAAKGRRS